MLIRYRALVSGKMDFLYISLCIHLTASVMAKWTFCISHFVFISLQWQGKRDLVYISLCIHLTAVSGKRDFVYISLLCIHLTAVSWQKGLCISHFFAFISLQSHGKRDFVYISLLCIHLTAVSWQRDFVYISLCIHLTAVSGQRGLCVPANVNRQGIPSEF